MSGPVRIPLTIVAPGGKTDGVIVAVLNSDLDALEAENEAMRDALQAVWDELEDLMVFDPVRQRVKETLRIREFGAYISDAQPTHAAGAIGPDTAGV